MKESGGKGILILPSLHFRVPYFGFVSLCLCPPSPQSVWVSPSVMNAHSSTAQAGKPLSEAAGLPRKAVTSIPPLTRSRVCDIPILNYFKVIAIKAAEGRFACVRLCLYVNSGVIMIEEMQCRGIKTEDKWISFILFPPDASISGHTLKLKP